MARSIGLGAVLLVLGCTQSGGSDDLYQARSAMEEARLELSAARDDLTQATSELEDARRGFEAATQSLETALAQTSKRPTTRAEDTVARAEVAAKAEVECDGDRCTIKRSFADKVVANPALLARQARIVPALKDGEVRGFKMYGIRNGSLPKLLGLENGDMVTAVNGRPMTSMDQSMAAFAELRKTTSLTIELERKGQAKKLVVAIE